MRILMLGVVAVGLFLALTTTASSGKTLGQATGYGDDTIPPSQLETATPANSSTSGGGGHATLIFGVGLVVVILGGAGAYAYSRTRP